MRRAAGATPLLTQQHSDSRTRTADSVSRLPGEEPVDTPQLSNSFATEILRATGKSSPPVDLDCGVSGNWRQLLNGLCGKRQIRGGLRAGARAPGRPERL